METSLPVALSGQIAMEKRLETLAHNLANVRTVGFRAEEVRFEELLSRTAPDPVAFVTEGETYLSNKSGALTQTGNPLDLAIRGEAFFAYQGQNGLIYTRDGRMEVTPEGTLQTLTGRPLVDSGGAPLQIDPAGGPIVVSACSAFRRAPICPSPIRPALDPTGRACRSSNSPQTASSRAMWKRRTSIRSWK